MLDFIFHLFLVVIIVVGGYAIVGGYVKKTDPVDMLKRLFR
jgi:hypothetical protein